MSEAQRSALNALLFRTGDQSKDIVLALATNRPGDLDSAVTDRIDEVLEFPLPGEEERFKLLKLYLDKYIVKAGENAKGKGILGRGVIFSDLGFMVLLNFSKLSVLSLVPDLIIPKI